VLLVVVIVGAAVLMALRRTLTRRDGGGAGGYTLQDLRQMHATGELSDEEFERARQSIIERVKSPRSENRGDENRGDENQAEESPGKSPRAGT
jgi:hypothetical protein